MAFIPAVDVREEADRFVSRPICRALQPADIDVTAEKGVLTLRGERKAEKREAVGRLRAPRACDRQLSRAASPCPENVQADAIKAKFTHGVLEVSIPKQPVVAAKRVQVETH